MKADRLALILAALLILASCGVDAETIGIAPDEEPSPTPRPTTTPVPTATPTPVPAPTPTTVSTPTPTPVPQRVCVEDPDAHDARIDQLEQAVTAALSDYPGTFGFALYDIECDAMATVNGDYVQYTASTGKLPFVIAALRAIEEGRLDFEQIEGDLELVLRQSLDDNANTIVSLLDIDEVWEVLQIAGVSDQTTFQDSWSDFFSTAPDLSRIWAAVLRGDLLNAEWTEYLLGLAAEAEVPPLFETFSSEVDLPGLQFGQKAGYAVQLGPPYYLIGSGYLRPESGSGGGFTATLLTTTSAALTEPQRRAVFPLVVEFVRESLAELGLAEQ